MISREQFDIFADTIKATKRTYGIIPAVERVWVSMNMVIEACEAAKIPINKICMETNHESDYGYGETPLVRSYVVITINP